MKKSAIFIFVFLVALYLGARWNDSKDIEYGHDPDMFRNVSTLITSKGYPVEEHTVNTPDGFILTLHRIPLGRRGLSAKSSDRKVVYMQHGLLASAAQWVINFPEQSLGFVLADAGCDVWMGNTRGNTYSRHHAKYTPEMQEFWDYSFDEMAEYDLPSSIDYVLNATGQKQLYYIGYSQGTTSVFAMLSESQEYNEKIKLCIALAPLTSTAYMTSAFGYMAPLVSDLHFLFKILGVKEFLPRGTAMKVLSEQVCNKNLRFICENGLFLISGFDKYQLNSTRMGVYSAHVPAGTSTKSVVHFGQMMRSDRYCKYDYGKRKNLEYYNQETSPEYDLSRITAPVSLVWSLNDILTDPVDVAILEGQLKTVVSSFCVPYPYFTHTDYIFAVDAHKLYHGHILDLLAQH